MKSLLAGNESVSTTTDTTPTSTNININYNGYIKPNGYLVLISPYSWLDEYTPPDEWLFKPNTGTTDTGTTGTGTTEKSKTYSDNSFIQLSNYIKEHCHTTTITINNINNTKTITKYALELFHRDIDGVPFLIREHARKYQFGLSDCTIFKNVIISVDTVPL